MIPIIHGTDNCLKNHSCDTCLYDNISVPNEPCKECNKNCGWVPKRRKP